MAARPSLRPATRTVWSSIMGGRLRPHGYAASEGLDVDRCRAGWCRPQISPSGGSVSPTWLLRLHSSQDLGPPPSTLPGLAEPLAYRCPLEHGLGPKARAGRPATLRRLFKQSRGTSTEDLGVIMSSGSSARAVTSTGSSRSANGPNHIGSWPAREHGLDDASVPMRRP